MARRRAPPAVTIRAATSADASALAALDERAFPPADRFSLRVWRYLLGDAARRRSAASVIAVAADGAALGSAALLMRRGSHVARLYTVAVDPAARGLGLGARLIGAALARAPRRCDVVSLEVRADNAAARALYERLGLVAVGGLPGYYADGAAGVRYRGGLAEVAAATG
jgi:ribosomal-protein-alanine N-acetyltransferase